MYKSTFDHFCYIINAVCSGFNMIDVHFRWLLRQNLVMFTWYISFSDYSIVYVYFGCWQGRIGSFLVGSKWIPVHGYCVGKLLDYVKFFPSFCGTAFGHFYLVLCECKQWKFPSWFVDLSGLKRLPLVLSREIDKTVTRSWDLITTSEENILF